MEKTRAEKALAVMDAMRDGILQINRANGFKGRWVAVASKTDRHESEADDDPVAAGVRLLERLD